MKNIVRKFPVFVILSVFMFLFSGCLDIAEDDSYETDDTNQKETDDGNTAEIVTATETDSWKYDSDEPIFEVESDVLTLNISGDIGGKTAYLVKVNSGDTSIAVANQRYIPTGSSSGSGNTGTFTPGTSGFGGGGYFPGGGTFPGRSASDGLSQNEFRHFVPPVEIELPSGLSRSSARSVSASRSVTAIDPVVDETPKEIYVDQDTDISEFAAESATLRAVGEYCYVWVIDDYYAETAADDKVDSSIAQTFADKFDSMYPLIRKVFGEESDSIIDYDSQTLVSMSGSSDTGTMVNIVIYDIGDDYDKTTTSGVLGYFYSKDYYYSEDTLSGTNSVINYSNVGKYFYVDSYYANSDSYSDTIISTLAHEFQHMINFGVKRIGNGVSMSTAYNEMLSMLCEDMMQEYLGIEDSSSPKGRLKNFNGYYYLSGLTEYRSTYSAISYANFYAFGAWLCRQYGGAALVKEIMSNDYTDSNAIVSAVNSLNGTDYDMDELVCQFMLALTGSESYTLNQDAAQTVTYTADSSTETYDYPMSAVDLWADDYSIEGTTVAQSVASYAYSEYDYTGPLLLSSSSASILRPNYGFTLHGIQEIDSGETSLSLTFSSSGSSAVNMYVIIQ